jgi:hypothetical protein
VGVMKRLYTEWMLETGIPVEMPDVFTLPRPMRMGVAGVHNHSHKTRRFPAWPGAARTLDRAPARQAVGLLSMSGGRP